MGFKLTYYYGRMGALGPGQIVGHPEALISTLAMGGPNDDFGPPGAGGAGGQRAGQRRRKAQKHVGAFGVGRGEAGVGVRVVFACVCVFMRACVCMCAPSARRGLCCLCMRWPCEKSMRQ